MNFGVQDLHPSGSPFRRGRLPLRRLNEHTPSSANVVEIHKPNNILEVFLLRPLIYSGRFGLSMAEVKREAQGPRSLGRVALGRVEGPVRYDDIQIPSRGGSGKLTRELRASPSRAPTLDVQSLKTRVSPSGCLCSWRSAGRTRRSSSLNKNHAMAGCDQTIEAIKCRHGTDSSLHGAVCRPRHRRTRKD